MNFVWKINIYLFSMDNIHESILSIFQQQMCIIWIISFPCVVVLYLAKPVELQD